jgi:Flp pilus assembly pilin Flp
MRAIRAVGRFVRDHSGVLAATFGLIATYLASYVALIPPEKRLVPGWLAIFAGLCTLGFIASLIQQKAANTQAKAAEALELQQTEMLEKIAQAVGATQAEVAETTAETKRQIVELQVKISDESKPVVIIRFNVDGDKDPTAVPTVENVGKGAATNIKIEDISVEGTKGPGQFEEIDSLRPGESRSVTFYSVAEGPLFGTYLIRYLYTGLENRPPFDWSKVKTQDDAHDLFAPMKMPIFVVYTDPATGKRYRSEHELEFHFSQHVAVIFQKQTEIA